LAWKDEVAARLRTVNAAAGDLPVPPDRQRYWQVIAAVAEGMVAASKPGEGSSIVRAHVHELAPNASSIGAIDAAFDSKSPGTVLEAIAAAGTVISTEEQKGLEAALIQAFGPPPPLGLGNPSAAWLALHRAEEDVLMVCTDAYAGLQAIELKGRVSRLKPGDPTIADFQAFLAQFQVPKPDEIWPPMSAQARDWLRMILHHLNAASDHYQDQLRTWRNGLWAMTAALTVSVIVIAVVGFASPYTIGLCGPLTAIAPTPSPSPAASPAGSPTPASPSTSPTPQSSASPVARVSSSPSSSPSTSPSASASASPSPVSSPTPVPSPSTSAEAVCLDGGTVPSGRDWLFVLLFGLAGGLLSAVVTLRNVDSSSNSYRIQMATTASKIPLGVVIAAMGVFVVQRGLFDILQPQSGLKILAFAFAFGFGQQAFTQALDSRTNALLGVATAQSSTGSSASSTSTSTTSSASSSSQK
jgi:hypothetical protein